MKLKKSVKAKWVKALRSGKYAQATGMLHGGEESDGRTSHCCLGVACNVGLAVQDSSGDEFVAETFLPREVQEKLANYNDGIGKKKRRSFNWIASYIERYL